MKRTDLHVHSTASDGTLSPSELVRHAIANNISTFSLTDHDTITGISEASKEITRQKQLGNEIALIPGIELSAEYKNRDIHILGLFLDPTCESLLQELTLVKEERDLRNQKMVTRLQSAGLKISLSELTEGNKDSSITRAHFAKYLINKGYARNTEDAFCRFLGFETPFYVTRQYLSPARAIEVIKKAGGIPVLAHPLLYHLSNSELSALLLQLKTYGLEGLEVFYASNISNDEATLYHLAKKNRLVMTGGTDFHGANKPNLEIGTGRGNFKVPDWVLPALETFRSTGIPFPE